MLGATDEGRAGTPDEVANVAAILMGLDGAFITGGDFLMDGGVTSACWRRELGPAVTRQWSGGLVDTAGEILIRPARPSDVSALGRLGALLVGLHHDLDAERFIAPTPRTELGYGAFLNSQLAAADAIVLVAEQSGAVLGYTYAGLEGTDYMSLRGPAGVIYDLVVDAGRRREGVGRRLLEAARTALVERGAPHVLLSTAERNHAAQRLFAAAGFRPTMIEMSWEPSSRRTRPT